MPQASHAQGNRYWSGGGGNGLWNWNNNWWNSAPVAGDRVWFEDNDAPLVTTNNSGVNINWVMFTNNSGGTINSRTIEGGVNLTDWSGARGKIENWTTATHTINGGVVLNGGNTNYEINPISGSLIINGGVTANNAAKTINFFGGNTVTINGGIIGASANAIVLEAGSGDIKVILNDTSTYTGTTFIDRGTLTIGGSISSSSMVFLGSGTAGQNAALVLSNTSTFGNAMQINSGGGTRTLTKTGSGSQTMTGLITNNNALTLSVDTSGGVLAITNILSGTGSINKTGSGTLILLGGTANSMSGAMTNAAGTLILNKTANTAAIDGSLTISSGATLRTDAANQLNNELVTVNGTFNMNSQAQSLALAGSGSVTLGSATMTISNTGNDSFTGGISGTGGLIKTGAGTQTLSSLNSYTGTVQINQGTLSIAAESGLGGSVASLTNNMLQFGGGTLAVTGSFTMSSNRGITLNSGGGTIDVASSQTLTYGGLLTGASGNNFTKTGAGGLTLSANNSSSLAGSFRILGGTVTITNVNSLGSGVLELGATTTQGVLVVNSNNTRSQNILITDNSTNSVINVASGQALTTTGSLTQGGTFANTTKFGKAGAGTLILAGSSGNSFNGQIQIGEGTVIAGTSTALGTNTGTGQRAIDLGLDISDAVSANNVALLASNGVTVGNSFFVAGNGGTRTIGLAESGSATFSNQFFMNGNLIVDAGSSASDSVTISGNLTNSGGIIKTNAGILVLSASNNHSGGTTLGQGTLRINNARALGTGAFTISGASTFDNTSGAAITLANNNTQNWNADFTFTGSTNLNLGTGAVTLGGSRIVTVSGNALTVGGAISGNTFNITKAGAGTLILGGNITTTSGNVTVNANSGTLTLGGANTFTGGVTLNSGSTLNINSTTALGAASSAFTISGGTINNSSGGAITLANNNAQNWNGNFAFTGSSSLNMGTGAVAMNASRQITVNGSTLTIGGIISGSTFGITKLGTGNLTLSGANSYTGATTITAGTLELTAANVISDSSAVTVNGGTWALNANADTVASVSMSSGTINRGGAVLTASGASSFTGGTVNYSAAAAGITLGSTLELGGVTFSYNSTGTPSVDTVRLGGNVGYGSSATAQAVFTNTDTGVGAFDLGDTQRTFNITNSGTLGAATPEVAIYWALRDGGLTKDGTGALLLGRANTHTNTTLTAGDLLVADNASAGAGTLNLNGGVIASANSTNRTLANSLTIGGDVTFGQSSGGTGALTFSSVATNALGGTRTLTTLVDTKIDGALGGGGITKAGGATLSLSNTNSSFGALTIGAGQVNFQTNATITGLGGSAGSLALGGGTLTLNISTNASFGLAISGSGNLVKSNAGTLTLTGANTFSGLMTVNGGGAISVGADTNLGTAPGAAIADDITLANGTLAVTTNFTMNANRGITLGTGGGTLDVAASQNLAYGGIIAGGANALTKANSGTLTLSGVSSYTGATTISGGTLALSGSGALSSSTAVNASASGSVFDISGISAAGTTVGSLAGAAGSTVNLGTSKTLTVGGNNSSTTFAGVMSNTGGLTKTGSGVMTLSGANTYTGVTTVSGGTLRLGNTTSGTAVAGNVTINGGTVDYDTSATANNIATTSTVTLSSGTYALGTRAQTLAGLDMSGGSLTRGGAILTLAGASTITGGTLSFSSAGSDIRADGALTLGGATFEYTSGSAGVATDGFRVGGNVTYGAGNTVAASFTNTSAGIGRLSLNNGTRTFDIADIGALGSEVNVAWAIEFGSLIKTGAGVMTMTASNSYNNTTLNGGTLRLGNNFALGAGTVSISNNSVIASDGATARTFANVIDLAGDVTFGDATGTGALTFSATNADNLGATSRTLTTAVDTTIAAALTNASGNITKAGAATLYLNNASSSFGALSISAGRVTFQTNATVTGLAASGGSLELAGGALTLNSATNNSFGQVISGAGGLTKASGGTLTLSGVNTYTGVTTINGGAISVAAASSLGGNPGSATTNQLTLNGGALNVTTGFTANADAGITVGASGGTIDVATSQRLIQGGGLYGSGALTKAGQGTFSLTNTASSYSGTITVTNGVLQANTTMRQAAVSVGNASTVSGSVLMGSGQIGAVTINTNGQISPGNSVGTLSVSNSLTFNGGGSYLWEINGTNGPAGTTWDLITVDNAAAGDGLGNLTIGGAFTITGSAIDGYSFDGGQNYAGFQIVKASSLTGSLGNLSLSGLGTGSWAFTFTNNVGLFASYTAAGSTITFTNSASADQGAANIAGGNPLGAYATITNVGGATIVVISNTAPLTFTNEANSYTGATIIEEGTAVTMVNALNAANGAFGNASTDIQIGSTNSGNTNAATLLIGASGATVGRVLTINSGGTGLRTVGATNSSGTATYSGNIAMATNVTLSASNSGGTTLFSGGLSGAGNVTAAGSGTVVLSGANTYSGTTTVTNGTTLLIANNTALGSAAAGTTVQSGGMLALSNGITVAEALTITGTGVGGVGALYNLDGANTVSGAITLGTGGAEIGNAGTTLTLSGGITGAGQPLTIDFATAGKQLIITNLGINTATGGSLVKTNSGTLIITASGDYTGGTTLGGGTIRVGNNSALGTGAVTLTASSTISSSDDTARSLANNFVINGGTLTLGSSANSGAMTIAGTVALGNTTRTIEVASISSPATISGAISGDANVGLTKTGTGTLFLTGANTYDGTTTISQGALSIGSGGGTGSVAGAISISNTNNTLIVNRTGDITLGGVISGAGAFNKLGSGTLLLSGNNSFTGNLAISNGAVRISNANGLGATNGATIVSSGAALELTGGITTPQEGLTLNGSGISSGGALRNISGNNTYAGNITLGSASTIASDAGLLTISGGINGANFALTNTGAGNITISSAITNSSGALVKEGLGTLTLTGANTYSGGTLVSAGTLVGDTTSLQGTITNSSLVIFDQSADGTYSSVVSGTGALIKTNTGVLTLTGDNTYTGGTTIGAGALQIGNGGGTGSLAGTITNNGGLVFNRTGSLSITGAISGSGVLTNLGAGTVTLSGANTYSGGTLISAGALQGDTTSLQGTITNNAAIIFDQSTNGTYSGALSGAGALIKTNAGVLTLTGASSQTGTLIGGGTLAIGAGGTIGSLAGPITNNATLLFNRSDNLTQASVISGSGVLNKAGAGTLTLSQANTYEGATTISNGAISISDASALGTAAAGTTVVSGAALELSGGITVASESLTLNGTGISTGGALRNISGNNAYNGAISLGAASRINSDAGTLSLGGGITGTGFGLTVGGNGNTTIGTTGINTGASGTLTKDGSGTLTITAAGDYTGATTVSAGVLNIQNATATGTTAGGISVTSGAALQIQGGITVGTEALTLNGSGISTDGALRSISGNNVYGGAITLGSASRINSDADALTLNGGITGTGVALTIGGAGNTTIGTTGINTGAAGTLTKDGLGTLTITAAGDYTGLTTVSAGALNIQNATATGTTAGGISVTSGAALELQGNITVGAESLALNGTGIGSGGALRNISGNNTYGGTITLGSASRINSDAGTLTLSNITGTQNLTIGGAANTVLAGVISTSTGTLTKDGVGTATLSSGANTFTGDVNISAGTLAVTNGGAIANSAVVTVDSGATFSVLGGETVGRFTGAGTVNIAASQTLTTSFNSFSNNFAGTLTGAGGLTKTGSGTLTLSGANTFSGGLQLDNGTILVGNNTALGTGTLQFDFAGGTGTRELVSADASSYTLNNNFNLFFNSLSLGSASTGSLTLGASTNTFFLGSDGVSTTRTITVTGNQIIGAAVTGGANNNLNKAGSGTLILAGDASALGGTITNSAGRLQIGNGSTTGTLGSKNVTVASSAELAFNRSDNLSYGGVASGAGSMLKLGAGTVTFTAANTYTGATTISNGSLALSGSGALSSSSALNVAASGANFSIAGISGTNTEVASLTGVAGSTVSLGVKALTFGGNNANSTFAGDMSGTDGRFIKTGTGTVTLTGSNSMTGTSQLNDGTILIGNNFALGTNSFQIQFDVGGTKTLASDGSTARTLQITNLNVFNALTLGFASTGTGALTITGRVYLGDEVGQTRTITTATGTGHTFSGAVTGNRGMIKEGSGTLALSGANTFGGGLQLNNGTILVGNNAALGTGTMQFDFAGGTGTRALASIDASSYTLANNFNLFFNALTLGQTEGGTGTLTLGASTNTFNLGSDGTPTTRTITVNGTQIIGAAVTGGANNSLNKAGSGTLILAGDASGISGTITNSAGRLQIGNGSTTGTIGNDNVTVSSGAELAFNRSDNLSYGGVVSGAGSLIKFGAGTLTLSSANTFTGSLTIGGGGLSVSANNQLGSGTAMTISNAAKLLTTASLTSTRSLTVGDGGAEINVATNTVFTSTGAVSGSTALTKTGGGTLSLSNASSSYNGTVAVTAGTMQVNGAATNMNVNITNAGSVLMGAGSIGAVTVNSGTFIAPGNSVGNLLVSELTLQGGGGYNWEINASTGTAGTDWDLITVGGGGGNVAINSSQESPFTIFLQGNPTGWNVASNYSWTIIDAGTLTGFATNAFAVNFGGFTGATPTGTFSFSNVSGNLVMAYSAAANVYNVTVATGAVDQGAGVGITGGTNQFTGDYTLNKLGAGTLVMTNPANNYTGLTTIKEGTIQIDVNAPNNAEGALGTANTAVVIGDSTNNVAAGFNIGVAGVTNGRGLSVVAGTGAADRVIGTTITSGVAEQAGTVAVNTNTTFSAATGGTLLVSGAISQSGNITISSGGTNIFSGANTYSGTTTILTNATLTIANNSALGATNGATTVNNGGTLALSNNISTAENITIAGTGGTNNDGALRNLSGTNISTGTITLSANATIAADSGTSLQLGNINNGATNNGLSLSTASNSTILLTGNMSNTDTNTTIFKTGTGSLVISNGAANNTAGAQLQVAAGTVTLASGTFSTNTSAARRALDLGLNPDNSGSTNSAAFFVNSGLTLSNTIYVAPGTGARILGTESTSGTATFGGEIYLENNLTVTAAEGGTATFSGAILNTGNLTKSGSGTVTLSGANTFTGNVDITAGRLNLSNSSAIGNLAAVTVSNGATLGVNSFEEIGSLAGEGNVSLNALLIAGGNNTSTVFSGVMTNGGGFVKAGTSTMTLSGANVATGETFIVGGTLLFATNQGSSFNNTIQLGETNGAAGATLALGGSGVTLSNLVNVRSGSSGTMTIVATNATGTSTLANGLTLNKAATLSAQSGGALVVSNAVTLGANQLRVTNAANSAVTIAGNISSSSRTTGELLIDGPGTTTLTGNNSGDLKLTLSAGTLIAGSIANLGDPTGAFFGDKLNLNGGTLSATNDITTGGSFGVTISANGGNLLASSGRTLTLTEFINDTGAGTNAYTLGIGGGGTVALQKATGNNQFNGNMTFAVTNGSTLSTPNLLALGNSSTNIISLNNGTFAYTGSTGTASQRFTLGAGGGTISVTAASLGTTLTLTNIVSGAGNTLTKAGDSILVLSGANTYGKSVINGGMLTVGADNNLGTAPGTTTADSITIGNGRLGLNGNFTLSANRGITLTNANSAIDVYGGNTATVAGVITGAGGLTKFGAGTMILTAANNYEGGTTISVGTLQVGNGGATGQLGTGNITNNAALVVNRTGTININDIISGTGTLTKQAAGTLTLSANNSLSGGSTLSAGVIRAAHNNALGTGALVSSAGTTLELTNSINVTNTLSVFNVNFLDGGNTLSGRITNNNTVYTVNTGQTNTLSGYLTGTGSVTLIGGGVLDITGTTNDYTGNTVISNGTVRISTLTNTSTPGSLGVSNNVTLAGANASNSIIDYTGGTVTTDRMFVFNGVATNGEGGTINISNAATTVTMTGSASGTGKMIVSGPGALVLSNTSVSNSFAPASIQVNSGSTLTLGANNQIGDNTGLILNGGTFLVGAQNLTESLGTLTLSASSIIDFGAFGNTGLRNLTFANSTAISWASGAILTITNWQGVAYTPSAVSQIMFGGNGLTGGQLDQIRFAGFGGLQGGFVDGQLVPVPEPRVYAAAIALLAAVGWRERKRLIGLLRRKR